LQLTFCPTAAVEDSKLPKLGIGILSSDSTSCLLLAAQDIARRSHRSIDPLHHSYNAAAVVLMLLLLLLPLESLRGT